jgi:hypothetical protein
MHIQERIAAFVKLGYHFNQISKDELDYICQTAKAHNGWFSRENVELAIAGIRLWLEKQQLEKWVKNYAFLDINPAPKRVGLVMAGNIPLVGFHDFLSVLITGNNVQAKLSSQDPFLPKYLVEKLTEIEPRFLRHIQFVDRLKTMDAIIATGSDNTSRYFEYYFGKYPHIIRKNRTSCAILSGGENTSDFINLGKDIFYYFGLGCRNVSKLFVPRDYDFKPLTEALSAYSTVMDNHKYANNYHYNRSIFLVNQTTHLDLGFSLLRRHKDLVSPTSVVYYEEYPNDEWLESTLSSESEKLQCTVSKDGWFNGSFPFGKAQEPTLWDYADHVDTVKFLLSLE